MLFQQSNQLASVQNFYPLLFFVLPPAGDIIIFSPSFVFWTTEVMSPSAGITLLFLETRFLQPQVGFLFFLGPVGQEKPGKRKGTQLLISSKRKTTSLKDEPKNGLLENYFPFHCFPNLCPKGSSKTCFLEFYSSGSCIRFILFSY